MAKDGCPTPSVLRRHVDQSSDAQPSDEIAIHVAECPQCRGMLAEAEDDGDVARWRELWANHREVLRAGESATVVLPCDDPVAAYSISTQVQGFEIIGVLGRGGSGVVYKARQLKLDRLVALKMLSAGARASNGAIARLRAESSAIARLQHPQVVTIHNVDEHQGVPYLCLELVEGGNLADRLEGKPLAADLAASLTASLARVVQDAHNRGVIHRDLKPANVLVSGPRDAPLDPARLKLTDFGLAKRLNDEGSASASTPGMIIGTPSYMAPELATGRAAENEPGVDIYGLGAILYELLTGQPPFCGDSPLHTVQQVVNIPPPAPSQLNKEIVPAIEAICLRCLEKEPAARYATAQELAEELERFASRAHLVNSKPQARSGGRPRYKRTVIASLVASAMAAVLGIVLFQLKSRPVQDVQDAPAVLVLTSPSSCPISQTEVYTGAGKIELFPALAAFGARSQVVGFDLSTDVHRRYLDESRTRNARIWTESRYGIQYWGPVDDHFEFEVAYRIPFDFPICSASLYSSLNPIDAEAIELSRLEVSTNLTKGWIVVARGMSVYPHGGPVDISKIVRGSRVVFIRAVMKGKDDHNESSTAQFLRTSTLADGHLEVKSPYVFEMRAYDREVPIVSGTVRFSDRQSWALWPKEDGSFTVERSFSTVGRYQGEILFSVSKISKSSKIFDVWVNSPDWSISIKSVSDEIQEDQRFCAEGRLKGGHTGLLSGVVDYGDESGEAKLPIGAGGSFRLEHVYGAARRYAPRVTIRDRTGHMATEVLTCVVVPREPLRNVLLLQPQEMSTASATVIGSP
jgi:serine/threonine protein kinase